MLATSRYKAFVCTGLVLVALARAGDFLAAANTSSASIRSSGGSNFVLIRPSSYGMAMQEPEASRCAEAGWADMRSIVSVYNIPAARLAIDSQLNALYAAGQRKITLFLWHFENEYTYPDNVYCTTVKAQAVLPVQYQANVRDLVRKIKQVGFNQLNFRFGPSNQSNPLGWTAWDEDQYQSNWSIVYNTRNLIYSSLNAVAGKNPKVVIDLAAEFAGTWMLPWEQGPEYKTKNAIKREYARRLWDDYTKHFGTLDTIGFSIVPAAREMIEAMIDVYDEVGRGRPASYGFDVYGNIEQVTTGDPSSIGLQFSYIKAALQAKSELGKEVYLQETYFNSPDLRRVLLEAEKTHGIALSYIYQWPLQYRTGVNYNVSDMSPFMFFLPGFNKTGVYRPSAG